MDNKIIPGMERLSAAMGRASLQEFTKVRSLTFGVHELGDGYSLVLQLDTDRDSQNFRISIRCDGVVDLELKRFGSNLTQINGLHIFSISKRGWEGKNWRVQDFENSTISLYCNDVVIASVEKLDTLLS